MHFGIAQKPERLALRQFGGVIPDMGLTSIATETGWAANELDPSRGEEHALRRSLARTFRTDLCLL